MGKGKELAEVCKQTDDNYETCKIRMQVNFSFMQTLYKLGNQLISRSERDPGSISSFTVRFKDIDNYKTTFQDACNVVMSKCSEETRSDHDQCLNDFYEMYYSIQVLKETILPPISQTQQSMNQPSRTQQVCLPKIAIPHYSGVYVEWPNFIAMFDSLIHNNTELSNVPKNALLSFRLVLMSELNYTIAYC